MNNKKSALVLIKNVKIFDGVNESLITDHEILIENNKIKEINKHIVVPNDTLIINGNGGTLIPGLIDTHTHITMAGVSFNTLLNSDREYLGIIAAKEAELTLLRGFTTIRDMSGPSFGIKQAIDEEQIVGPRIYPSGAGISQTSGHVDLRSRIDPPRCFCEYPSPAEKIGVGIIADGVEQVLIAVREQLRLGASQIKIMAGGGIASKCDPIDVVEYTDEEIKAAVNAAADWGTYVAVHAYNSKAITRCLQNGVRSIEHGNLIDEPTMKLMAKCEAFLSPQVVVFNNIPESLGESALIQAKILANGLDAMFELAKKYNIKITFGTDLIFSSENAKLQSKELTARLEWFSAFEILKQATSIAAELLALSGARNPYPGKLGVIAADALADLLIIDGNPLQQLTLLENPEKNIKLIMKNGAICKNTL